MVSLSLLRSKLLSLENSGHKKSSQNFFKTGAGGYAEGDIFIGVQVPELRKLAKEFKNISLVEISTLISSRVNEERLLSLLILVIQFPQNSQVIYDFYLEHIRYVNNWNLVDQSACYIMGAYLLDKDRKILYKLAESQNIWERRIAIVSTWRFIRSNDFDDALNIIKKLLPDNHDLIHKAMGWMLREIGKRDEILLKQFLAQNNKIMPRTTLRYAIERFNPEVRKQYLKRD